VYLPLLRSYFYGCISADQLVKDQRATHQPDNFKISNNLLAINKKPLKLAPDPSINKQKKLRKTLISTVL
jgi:hypothetical protein